MRGEPKMTAEASGEVGGRARVCGACGALNGADFTTCIRCSAHLHGPPPLPSADAAEAVARTEATDATAPDPRHGAKALLALTLMVFGTSLLASASRGHLGDALAGGTVADGVRYGALLTELAATKAEPFRLLSAVFVHFGALHLAANMLAFWQLSRIAEPAIGWARLVVVYVVTGVLGFVATIAYDALAHAPTYPTAGGSGAIFGLMGFVLGWMLRRRDARWKAFAIQAVFLSLLFGFGMNAMSAGILVNNSAHVGGLVAGVAAGVLLAGAPPPLPRSRVWSAIAGLALAASVLSLALAQLSPAYRAFVEPAHPEEAPDGSDDGTAPR